MRPSWVCGYSRGRSIGSVIGPETRRSDTSSEMTKAAGFSWGREEESVISRVIEEASPSRMQEHGIANVETRSAESYQSLRIVAKEKGND